MSLIEWVELPDFGDERGSLVVVESNKNIPFDIKRIYYIYDVKSDIPRGFHAHRELSQIAFCLKGRCKMLMDNGVVKEEVWLDQPNKGLLIPSMVWHEMHDFSEDCILLVLASDFFDENDYIRNYENFISFNQLSLVEYNQNFLKMSWDWLNDAELSYLTMTPSFTREEQQNFFDCLSTREDYFIRGIKYNQTLIGACGLKHISDAHAELWLYIGNKGYWGKGLGKKIMCLLEKEAFKFNLSKIYLKVLLENKIAINLYKKLGYIDIRVNDNYLLMEKVL